MPSNINFNLSIDLTDAESPVILAGLGAALSALGSQLSGLFASRCGESTPDSCSTSVTPDQPDGGEEEGTESTGDGSVVFSEVVADDGAEAEAEPEEAEAEPEEAEAEAEAEAKAVPEKSGDGKSKSKEKPVAIDPPRDDSPEEKARFRRDRMELIRRSISKVYADKPQVPHIVPPLPKKSMGQRIMEAFLERYTANPGVSCVQSREGYVVGVDYTMDGRPVTLHKAFTNGACVVAVKGTRYYRAVPLETLGHMFPAKASPKYGISDPKPGMRVYVGMGLETDEYARSFRKAVVKSVSKNGLIGIEYADNGMSSHCGVAQLSSKPLVR